MKHLFLSIILFAVTLAAHAETLTGFVVSIADGDTLTVLDANRQQHKIRLAGIDAPEHNQAFGERSRSHLGVLTFNKTVTVEWRKKDRYGRTVGKVLVNGVDANLEQLKAGMAWWYREYSREQSSGDRALYEQAEFDAKIRRIGLWNDKNPLPPWEFRHPDQAMQPAESCLCSGSSLCTGPKGGHYCVTDTGTKRYR